MSNTIDYGKLTKQVVFTENDHRHAKLLIRLKHDGFTQAAFFREIITGYIDGDERILNFVDDVKNQSKKKKSKSKRLRISQKPKIKKEACITVFVSFPILHRTFMIIVEGQGLIKRACL